MTEKETTLPSIEDAKKQVPQTDFEIGLENLPKIGCKKSLQDFLNKIEKLFEKCCE